ncbi:hypothetical protein LTR53_006333 [Teratosphaeriaceae sp. CCFEE 6253]|nr:hypothetical protein LTR53_006333 [Teratosphaeriaceae sp. CCFEE 6253]
MASEDSKDRETSETARCLIDAFGFHIHPSIPADGAQASSMRVADIACGTGIWLTEIATQYPQARCDGFDISSKYFPAPAELKHDFGDKVRFHTCDGTAEGGYGAEFSSQFDVVAVRLFHVSLAGAEWARAVRNAVALLKPGGYLQWIDWDPHSVRLVQSRALMKTMAIAELLAGYRSSLLPLDTGATARLAQELCDSGLDDVRSELFAVDEDPGWREHFLWTIWFLMPDLLAKRAQRGPHGSADAGDWLSPAEEEAKQAGMWVRTEMWCHVGRKPA